MGDFRLAGPTLKFPESVLIPSAAVGMLVGGWLHTAGTSLAGGMGVLAGLALWTLAEYLLHRFIVHGIDPFRSWHLEHHRHPEVPMRTPVMFSVLLVLTLAGMPLFLWSDRGEALALSCGLMLGHVVQEVVHYRLHWAEPCGKVWLAARWRHHDFHHHADDGLAFGTLSAVWDRLLGTQPSRRAMLHR